MLLGILRTYLNLKNFFFFWYKLVLRKSIKLTNGNSKLINYDLFGARVAL
jgi:hypothetical protein